MAKNNTGRNPVVLSPKLRAELDTTAQAMADAFIAMLKK